MSTHNHAEMIFGQLVSEHGELLSLLGKHFCAYHVKLLVCARSNPCRCSSSICFFYGLLSAELYYIVHAHLYSFKWSLPLTEKLCVSKRRRAVGKHPSSSPPRGCIQSLSQCPIGAHKNQAAATQSVRKPVLDLISVSCKLTHPTVLRQMHLLSM